MFYKRVIIREFGGPENLELVEEAIEDRLDLGDSNGDCGKPTGPLPGSVSPYGLTGLASSPEQEMLQSVSMVIVHEGTNGMNGNGCRARAPPFRRVGGVAQGGRDNQSPRTLDAPPL